MRVDLGRRKVVAAVRLDGTPIAVASGLDAIWALDTGSTLYRIAPGIGEGDAALPARVRAGRTTCGSAAARCGPSTTAPASLRVVAGDRQGRRPDRGRRRAGGHGLRRRGRPGRSTTATADWCGSTWPRTGRPGSRRRPPSERPSGSRCLAGSLWITGRGTDLVRVDPRTGDEQATVEIGASGIDVVALGGALWVPVRSAAVDPTGLPTMQVVRRVDAASRAVTTVARAGGRVDVHGLIAAGGHVWIADNRSGFLYRL